MNDYYSPLALTGDFPILQFGAPDAAELARFVNSLDTAGRLVRFNHATTPEMIDAHYRSLEWAATIVLGWYVDGVIQGLAEGFLHTGPEGCQAELALCVHQDCRGRGIGQALVFELAQAVARRGARRSVVVLTPGDRGTPRIVRRLGGVIDPTGELAVIQH